MTQDELKLLISGDPKKVVDTIKSTAIESTYETTKNQFDTQKHSVKIDKVNRPDKVVDTKDTNGKPTTATVRVSRLPIPLQKTIVNRAAAFLCGNPILLDCSPEAEVEENLLSVLVKIWEDNKLDYKSKSIAKLMMSETECAELWYIEPASEEYWNNTPLQGGKFRLRSRILANSKGDTLYPMFDAYGDMIAFGRGYKVKVADKEEERLDLYTAESRIMYVNADESWTNTVEKNPSGKIPVIYYKQDQTEWADVQDMIERLETLISNNADTNDYFGSPMLTVNGKITALPSKTEGGKVLELSGDGKVEYLTWNQAPEAIKFEIENLYKLIYSSTQTPDISFEQMKSLGTFSGIALKMLFMDAHMKAADKEEIFGECIQRRINFLKNSICTDLGQTLKAAIGLVIKPKFEYFLPSNNAEKIDILGSAVQYGIMSKETATRQNPLLDNPDNEIDIISASALDDKLNEDL